MQTGLQKLHQLLPNMQNKKVIALRVCSCAHMYSVPTYLYIFPYLLRPESGETKTFDLQPAQKQLKLKRAVSDLL